VLIVLPALNGIFGKHLFVACMVWEEGGGDLCGTQVAEESGRVSAGIKMTTR